MYSCFIIDELYIILKKMSKLYIFMILCYELKESKFKNKDILCIFQQARSSFHIESSASASHQAIVHSVTSFQQC